jgi:hypothetical protein
MASEAAEIAEDCLNHLEREEQALQSALETLGVVRAAALAGDVARLEALQDPQAEAAQVTRALTAEREVLRRRIAAILRVPASGATLMALADHCGPAGARLNLAARRVRELADRVDRLNLSNATLLEYCLGFTRRVLRDLTGGGTPAESYGPDGAVAESPCGPLLSARG